MQSSDNALPIKAIVNKVIENLSGSGAKQERISEEEIRSVWRKAAGRFASQRSRPVSLRKGKLVVAVEDSSLLYSLTLKKKEILEALGRELRNRIQDIQFRIGETSGERENQRTKEPKNQRTKHRR
jgi:hypothetical protein